MTSPTSPKCVVMYMLTISAAAIFFGLGVFHVACSETVLNLPSDL